MSGASVLMIVLAGGAGGRLSVLTDERAKPAVPYAAGFRLIDFVLSNAANSGLTDVWVIQQFHPASLGRHLRNGRPWDLDRLDGGLLVLHPSQGNDREGFHTGTADALWKQVPAIRAQDPDVVIVVSADAVYRMDYGAVVDAHLASSAELTMVTAEVDPADADRYGVVQVEDGRVVEYVYKPDKARGSLVANEVFVFDTRTLISSLEEAARAAGDDELADIGDGVLPSLVEAGKAREFRHEGYWLDVGTIDSYWRGHMDLLGHDPAFRVSSHEWPLRTHASPYGPGRVGTDGRVTDGLLGAGAEIRGSVERSVIGNGVLVEPGATVRDSVLLPGVVIRNGATVEGAVIDEDVEIPPGSRIGGPITSDDEPEVALVGSTPGAEAADGFTVAAGEIYPEREDEDPRV